jgi:hypothetical protein
MRGSTSSTAEKGQRRAQSSYGSKMEESWPLNRVRFGHPTRGGALELIRWGKEALQVRIGGQHRPEAQAVDRQQTRSCWRLPGKCCRAIGHLVDHQASEAMDDEYDGSPKFPLPIFDCGKPVEELIGVVMDRELGHARRQTGVVPEE